MSEKDFQIESKSIKVAEDGDDYVINIPKEWIDTGDDDMITITTAKAPSMKFVILHDANTIEEEEATLQAINAWIEEATDQHTQKRRYETIRARFEKKWKNW